MKKKEIILKKDLDAMDNYYNINYSIKRHAAYSPFAKQQRIISSLNNQREAK